MKSSQFHSAIEQAVPHDLDEVWAAARSRLGPFADGLRCYSTVDSTNDLAIRLADAGAREGTTLLADVQTAGRGRRGRTWFSPPGSGIYVSVILRPVADSDRSRAPTAPLTLAAGVALAEGVRVSTGLAVELKWPNDLVFERRKLAGILTEMATTGPDVASGGGPGIAGMTRGPAVVLGIGINVRTTAYPAALAATATSLEAELGRSIDRGVVLVETLAALAARYEDLREGRFDAILTAWRRLARSLPGSAIEWDGPDGVMRGQAIDIDDTGALLVRTQAGQSVRLIAGEVRWR